MLIYFICETSELIKLLLWNCHFLIVHFNEYTQLGREIYWHTSPTKIFLHSRHWSMCSSELLPGRNAHHLQKLHVHVWEWQPAYLYLDVQSARKCKINFFWLEQIHFLMGKWREWIVLVSWLIWIKQSNTARPEPAGSNCAINITWQQQILRTQHREKKSLLWKGWDIEVKLNLKKKGQDIMHFIFVNRCKNHFSSHNLKPQITLEFTKPYTLHLLATKYTKKIQ